MCRIIRKLHIWIILKYPVVQLLLQNLNILIGFLLMFF